MSLYFALTIGAFAFGVVCSAPLSWDGGWYLFNILYHEAPFIPHWRIITVPLHYPVVLVAGLTSDIRILAVVFGLIYIAVPIAALGLSWWIVRDRAPNLFVFPAMGLGLATLPGQFLFASEGIQAVQLFWPLLLAVLAGVPAAGTIAVPLLAALVCAAHPVSSLLLVFAAGWGILLGACRQEQRWWMWGWSAGLIVAAMLRLTASTATRSAYDAEQLTFNVLQMHYERAVAGRPLVAVALTWLAGIAVLLGSMTGRPALRRVLRGLTLVAIAGVAVALVPWAQDPSRWKFALDFRSWTVASSLPLMMLAGLERLRTGRRTRDADTCRPHRLRAIQLTSLVFALVFCVQSEVWHQLTTRLRDILATSPAGCVSREAAPWLAETPLYHWATPAYAVVLQGRRPRTLLLEAGRCEEARVSDAVWISLEPYPKNASHWFDIAHPLARGPGR